MSNQSHQDRIPRYAKTLLDPLPSSFRLLAESFEAMLAAATSPLSGQDQEIVGRVRDNELLSPLLSNYNVAESVLFMLSQRGSRRKMLVPRSRGRY